MQAEAIQVLRRRLEDGNIAPLFLNILLLSCFAARLRALIAAKLGELLGPCFSATECLDRALKVLATTTEPPGAQREGYMCFPLRELLLTSLKLGEQMNPEKNISYGPR
jgi:hypothetical protein